LRASDLEDIEGGLIEIDQSRLHEGMRAESTIIIMVAEIWLGQEQQGGVTKASKGGDHGK